MICLSNGNVKENQDYKEVIKRKRKVILVLLIFGVLTTLVAVGNEILNIVPVDGHISDLYAGMGVGLISVSIVFMVKYGKLLKNEIALKEERLKNLDEIVYIIEIKSFNIS